MKKFFTQNKDCDRIILSKLEDLELFYFCSPYINKYSQKLLCDEFFWKTRFLNKYSENVLIYKPKNMSLKNYYIFCSKLTIFINGDPFFYKYILTNYKNFKDIVLDQKIISCYNKNYYDLFLFLINFKRRKYNLVEIIKDSEEYFGVLKIYMMNFKD